jgi:hypothetical protein
MHRWRCAMRKKLEVCDEENSELSPRLSVLP